MAQRTVALCDGKYIGIETVYTVICGKQINIPEKIKELRVKSRNNELFCPCGCGSNLILVAGDKNLREQHFRIKDENGKCQVITEGKTSIDSKIVLKCWLDDNLHAKDLETRVPICAVSDSNRKYEFSFISRNRRIAVNYCYFRANLSNEKLSVLDENSKGIKIIHIVDSMNGGSDGQYPESLMKIQDRQGYCLLLSIRDIDYNTARLKAVFYAQDENDLWQEVVFSDGSISEYQIDSQNNVLFKGTVLEALFEDAKQKYVSKISKERQRQEEARQRHAEYLKQREAEEKERLEALQRQRAKQAEERRLRAAHLEEQRRVEAQKRLEERIRQEEEFKQNLETKLSQQEAPVKDAEGNRWIKCRSCGKAAKDSEFVSYGGIGHINLGICKECAAKDPSLLRAAVTKPSVSAPGSGMTVCPICGGRLQKRNGKFGMFLGCSNYPRCRFTHPISNTSGSSLTTNRKY